VDDVRTKIENNKDVYMPDLVPGTRRY